MPQTSTTAMDQKRAVFICVDRPPRSFMRETSVADLKPDVAGKSFRPAPRVLPPSSACSTNLANASRIVRVATPELSSSGDAPVMAPSWQSLNCSAIRAKRPLKKLPRSALKVAQKRKPIRNQKQRTSLRAKNKTVQHHKAPPGLLPIAELLL